MPEQSPTLPYPPVVEAPKEPKSRSERLLQRFALVGVLGAVALVGASESAGKSSAQEVSSATPLERSYVDRPDITNEPKIHFVYAVAKDGEDRQLDVNGTMTNLAWNSLNWQTKEDAGEGRSYRYDWADSQGGQLDASFVRLEKTGAEVLARGGNAVRDIQQELWDKGFSKNPDKVLMVMYDGDVNNNGACGAATWPPEVPGNTAILSLRKCAPSLPERDTFSTFDVLISHEALHPLGVVQSNAPNYYRRGHTSDKNDLMGDFGANTTNRGQGIVIDPGRDDYWNTVLRILTDNHKSLGVKIEGQGTVASDPLPNLYWGKNVIVPPLGSGGREARKPYCEEDCEMWFRPNDPVSLTAEPEDVTWKFAGWGGAGTGNDKRNIAITGEQSVTATFEPIVNVDIKVRGAGLVKVSGEKACKSTGVKVVLCHYELKPATKVELNAKAATKFRFIKWIGATTTKPFIKFTARHEQDKDYTAVFGKSTSAKILASRAR